MTEPRPLVDWQPTPDSTAAAGAAPGISAAESIAQFEGGTVSTAPGAIYRSSWTRARLVAIPPAPHAPPAG